MNVFIARRYQDLVTIISVIVHEYYPYHQMHITDSNLRLEYEISVKDQAPLSVIIIPEAISDRRDQTVWLKSVTNSIRKSSRRVFVILLCKEPEKYMDLYNQISEMDVVCITETIEDDFNTKQISDKPVTYLYEHR